MPGHPYSLRLGPWLSTACIDQEPIPCKSNHAGDVAQHLPYIDSFTHKNNRYAHHCYSLDRSQDFLGHRSSQLDDTISRAIQ